jgi:flagellar L-ring protein precursor FlgH
LLLPLAGLAASPAAADSIWDRRDPRYAELFKDNRARDIGDLVVVVISESTTANEREQRSLDKSNTTNGTGSLNGTATNSGTGSANFGLSNNFRRRFNGNAELTSGRTFTDRLTATVVDIMPNGNLVIEGYRSRVVGTEERVLRVTGVVRPQDIGTGNAVPSTNIANCRINYLGAGPATRTLNQNFFGRVMNRVWPW